MAENFTCPICGKTSSMYFGKAREDRLCREHKDELKAGKIEQCPDCATWITAGEICKCKLNYKAQENKKCIVCGNPSNGKMQCRNCYHETMNHFDNIDKNSSTRQLRDHYHNLKERIVIINSINEVKNQCNRLIAIAMLNNTINEDSSLLDRTYTDVEKIIKIKSEKQQPKTDYQKVAEEEKDQSKSKINTAQDGHNVDSDMEVRIDDILYNSFILHSYGKNINEIIEKRKKCDWFIPIANGQGIYIEYWGRDTEKYIEARKEKEELYKKYDIPYIGIEKDDPKQDTQTFTNNLIRDLTTLAIDKFGFMPKWKK